MTRTSRRGRGRPRADERDRGSSRAELVDAAASVFAERGYDGTSIEEVIRRAGLSKGTFYFNFADKEELFRAVIHDRLDDPARALMTITATADGATPTAAVVSAGLGDLVRDERDTVLLLHAYWLRAAHDSSLTARYRSGQASLRDALAETLEARHQHTGVPLTFDSKRLARGFIALAHGLALESVVDPEGADPALFGEMLSLVYDGLVKRAESG